EPVPNGLVMYFDSDIVRDLLKKELTYRNAPEDSIELTEFAFRLVGSRYEIFVLDQKEKRKPNLSREHTDREQEIQRERVRQQELQRQARERLANEETSRRRKEMEQNARKAEKEAAERRDRESRERIERDHDAIKQFVRASKFFGRKYEYANWHKPIAARL